MGEFAEAAGLGRYGARDLMNAFANYELAELAAHEARMSRCAESTFHEALPFLDPDDGSELGRVEARIPKTALMNWLAKESIGQEGIFSDDWMKWYLKRHPQFAVNTVSGKVVVGWTPTERKFSKKY